MWDRRRREGELILSPRPACHIFFQWLSLREVKHSPLPSLLCKAQVLPAYKWRWMVWMWVVWMCPQAPPVPCKPTTSVVIFMTDSLLWFLGTDCEEWGCSRL